MINKKDNYYSKIINEGKVSIHSFTEDKVSKELPVFYNPIMKFNRDTSILLLKCIDKLEMQIALPLSGSGIRGIRFIQELNEFKIKNITFNDYDKNSVKLIQKNLKFNGIKWKGLRKIKLLDIKNEDANLFLLNSPGFDYIDIDPFGPPTPFLDSAIKRISRDGILAITATDTSALSGTYPKVCNRKYWSNPVKNGIMHETGLRILIRRVQMIGISFEKALIPIFSFSKDHYMRVFFKCIKGKKKCDEVFSQFGMIGEAGPLWLGKLWDSHLCKKMVDMNDVEENSKFLETIYQESLIEQKGFYHIHEICKNEKISVPNFEKLFDSVKKKGFKISRTHFCDKGVRSNISYEELVDCIKKLN